MQGCMEINRASNQVSGIIQVMNLMKGDRDAKSMPKQLEKSDKSRIDPNDQEDAKSILDFQILPRQVPLPRLPLHVPFPLAVPSANIYGMSEHSRVTMNRRTAPCRVRTRNSSSSSKMRLLFSAREIRLQPSSAHVHSAQAICVPSSIGICSDGGKQVEEIDPLYRVSKMARGFPRTALANVEPIHAGEDSEAQKPVRQRGKMPV